MQFVVPYDQVGIQPPGPWTNASPAAGQKGSIVNADVFPAVQTEIINVITAAALTPSGIDFTQLLQAIKVLIPKYAPAAVGAEGQGGLKTAVDGNLLLALDNLPVETVFNAADKLALSAAESEDGLAEGTPFAATLGGLGAFIANLFQTAATFTQITATNLVGLSLAPTGDFTIPRGVATTVPLQPITVNNAFGSVTQGVLTLNRSGYYVVSISGAVSMISNGHATDTANLTLSIGAPGIDTKPAAIPPGGGQGTSNWIITFVTHFNAGDKIQMTASADNLYHDGNSCSVSGYTNMLVALLNS